MGRYFGITNSTKNMSVSSGDRCWKSYEWCDLYELMHRYRWDKTDDISSGCYDTLIKFNYDSINNKMIMKDTTREFIENNEYNDFEVNSNNHVLKLGFYPEDCTNNYKNIRKTIYNHIPNWKGALCINCNYEYDPKHIINDYKKFDKAYSHNQFSTDNQFFIDN